MHVVRYANPIEFAGRVHAFLRQRSRQWPLLGITNHLCADAGRLRRRDRTRAIVESDSEQDRDCVAVAIMTPPFSLLVQCDDQEATLPLSLIADDLAPSSWSVPRRQRPEPPVEGLCRHLGRTQRGHLSDGNGLRTFLLTAVGPPDPYSPGRLRTATMAEVDDSSSIWAQAFTLEAIGEIEPSTEPVLYTLCRFDRARHDLLLGRRWAGLHRILRAPFGPRHRRRHGLHAAPSSRPGLCQLMRGRAEPTLARRRWQFCTLFTDLANPTSNAIYQRIGYRADL